MDTSHCAVSGRISHPEKIH